MVRCRAEPCVRAGSPRALLCVAVAAGLTAPAAGLTVTGLSGGGCSGGQDTALLACRPGSSGAALTISGSGFSEPDPSGNTVTLTGGEGVEPHCYPLWTGLTSTTIVCQLYVFAGSTYGNWSVSVTTSGTTVSNAVSVELWPATPVLTTAVCVTDPCVSETAMTVSGMFMSNSTVEITGTDTYGLPTCTTSSAENLTLTCTVYVPPGATADYTVQLRSFVDEQQVSASVSLHFRNAAPVLSHLYADWCNYKQITTVSPSGPVLGDCTRGGGLLTIVGENFHESIPSLHTVSFSGNTEAYGAVELGFPATTTTSLPVPVCYPLTTSSTQITCELQVYVTGAFWITVAIANAVSAAARVYVHSAWPQVTNVSSSACDVNASAPLALRCPAWSTVTIAGSNFVPSPYYSYNQVALHDGVSGAPTCTVSSASELWLECRLETPPGTSGYWRPVIASDGNQAPDTDYRLVLDIELPSITAVAGDYCTATSSAVTCRGGGSGLPTSLVTMTGWQFSLVAEQNAAVFTHAEPGYAGLSAGTPHCAPYSAALYRTFVCALYVPTGVTGSWTLRVRVGDTLSNAYELPFVAEHAPPTNLSLAVPEFAVATEALTCVLTVHGGVFAHDAPADAIANASLRWWDGTAQSNGAVLTGDTYVTLADHRSDLGTYTLSVSVSLPGLYLLVVEVTQSDSWVPEAATQTELRVADVGRTAPVVVSSDGGGCSWTNGTHEAVDCSHGAVLTIIGGGFDFGASVIFSSAAVGCAESPAFASVPPQELRCTLEVSAPLLVSTRVTVGNSWSTGVEAAALWVHRPWSHPPIIVGAGSAVVDSGMELRVLGMYFDPNVTKNELTFAANAGEPPAAVTFGDPPTCSPVDVAADGTWLLCTLTCGSNTWGEWLLGTVAGNTSRFGVTCAAAPAGAPTVTGLFGCAQVGAEQRCNADHHLVTITGTNFEPALTRNVLSVTAGEDALGPAPACSIDLDLSSRGRLVCAFAASPQTYGLWSLVLTTTGGTAAALEQIRAVTVPVRAGLRAPSAVYVSGCSGQTDAHKLAVAAVPSLRGVCEHSGLIAVGSGQLDWRAASEGSDTRVEFEFAEAESAEWAAAKGEQFNATAVQSTPRCPVARVVPYRDPQSGYAYPSELYYQQVECQLIVPADAVGVWLVSVASSVGESEKAGLFAIRLPNVPSYVTATAPECTTAESEGALSINCTSGAASVTLVGRNFPADLPSTQIRFTGGTGQEPVCTPLGAATVGSDGLNRLECTLSCHESVNGAWSLLLSNTIDGSTSALGALVLHCHRTATSVPLVTAVSGCTESGGLLECRTGMALTLTGTGFDTYSTRNGVTFTADVGAEGGVPLCTTLAGGTWKELQCDLTVVEGTAGKWRVAISRQDGSVWPSDQVLTMVALPESPPTVGSVQPSELQPGGTLTVTGSGFSPIVLQNGVRFVATNTSLGTPPVCTPTAATPSRLTCAETAADATTQGLWRLWVDTSAGSVQGPTLAVGYPGPEVTGVSGCDFNSVPPGLPHCPDGVSLAVDGTRLTAAALAWTAAAGADGGPPSCAAVVAADGLSANCRLSVPNGTVGAWQLGGGPSVVPFMPPIAPPTVSALTSAGCVSVASNRSSVAFVCASDAVLTLHGAAFAPSLRLTQVSLQADGESASAACTVVNATTAVVECNFAATGGGTWWLYVSNGAGSGLPPLLLEVPTTAVPTAASVPPTASPLVSSVNLVATVAGLLADFVASAFQAGVAAAAGVSVDAVVILNAVEGSVLVYFVIRSSDAAAAAERLRQAIIDGTVDPSLGLLSVADAGTSAPSTAPSASPSAGTPAPTEPPGGSSFPMWSVWVGGGGAVAIAVAATLFLVCRSRRDPTLRRLGSDVGGSTAEAQLSAGSFTGHAASNDTSAEGVTVGHDADNGKRPTAEGRWAEPSDRRLNYEREGEEEPAGGPPTPSERQAPSPAVEADPADVSVLPESRSEAPKLPDVRHVAWAEQAGAVGQSPASAAVLCPLLPPSAAHGPRPPQHLPPLPARRRPMPDLQALQAATECATTAAMAAAATTAAAATLVEAVIGGAVVERAAAAAAVANQLQSVRTEGQQPEPLAEGAGAEGGLVGAEGGGDRTAAELTAPADSGSSAAASQGSLPGGVPAGEPAIEAKKPKVLSAAEAAMRLLADGPLPVSTPPEQPRPSSSGRRTSDRPSSQASLLPGADDWCNPVFNSDSDSDGG